jgi:hypothetical protein
MKGQLKSLFEVDMELELIQIDRYRVAFGVFSHLSTPSHLIEKTAILLRVKMIKKISRCEQ